MLTFAKVSHIDFLFELYGPVNIVMVLIVPDK